MELFSSWLWWTLTVLAGFCIAIYAGSPMSRGSDFLWALSATGLIIASFIITGWLAGIITFFIACGIGGFFAAFFRRA